MTDENRDLLIDDVCVIAKQRRASTSLRKQPFDCPVFAWYSQQRRGTDSADLMLGQICKRWANINPPSG